MGKLIVLEKKTESYDFSYKIKLLKCEDNGPTKPCYSLLKRLYKFNSPSVLS